MGFETIFVTNTPQERDILNAALNRTQRVFKPKVYSRAWCWQDQRIGQRTAVLVIYNQPDMRGWSREEEEFYHMQIAIWKHCVPPGGTIVRL